MSTGTQHHRKRSPSVSIQCQRGLGPCEERRDYRRTRTSTGPEHAKTVINSRGRAPLRQPPAPKRTSLRECSVLLEHQI